MAISDKYRIRDKEIEITLTTIDKVGFEEAIDEAVQCAIKVLEKDKCSTMATELLAWSHNLLLDSRMASAEKREILLMLSHFYRILSHRIYWHLLKKGEIGQINDFLHVV